MAAGHKSARNEIRPRRRRPARGVAGSKPHQFSSRQTAGGGGAELPLERFSIKPADQTCAAPMAWRRINFSPPTVGVPPTWCRAGRAAPVTPPRRTRFPTPVWPRTRTGARSLGGGVRARTDNALRFLHVRTTRRRPKGARPTRQNSAPAGPEPQVHVAATLG